MSVSDVRLYDMLRVGAVLVEIYGENNEGPPLGTVLEALADRISADPLLAAKLPTAIAPELMAASKRIRERLVERYGQKYVDDLLARLKK